MSPSIGYLRRFGADKLGLNAKDFDTSRACDQHAAILEAIAEVRGHEMKANDIVILMADARPFMVGIGEHGFEELLDRVEEYGTSDVGLTERFINTSERASLNA